MSHNSRFAVIAAVSLAVMLTACSTPGGSDEPSSSAGDSTQGISCGTEPVELFGYIETGFPTIKDLGTEFTKQYPNVTFNWREDQFAVITQNAPRILADDPPDLMRLPQMSELASQGLLMDLDKYAAEFGWDKWPASQLEQMRVDENGRRGSGPLYAMGINYSMTGVFYNKTIAEALGLSGTPATVAEFDEWAQKAKDGGYTPIVQFNGGATGGFAFPLQNLMAAYGDTAPINDWIYLNEGANINTPNNLKAVEHLKKWVDAGYFHPDANSLDYSQSMAVFLEGNSLFTFTGDWESGNFDTQKPGEIGFFLFPSATEGGKLGAMSTPLTYGIAPTAKNADCAAFFLNWIATNDEARTIDVKVGGSHPMGPADAFMPELDADSVTAATLAAGAKIAEDNGTMDFIANATGAIYAQSWTPNLQGLFAGTQTPAGLLEAVQKDYEAQVAEIG